MTPLGLDALSFGIRCQNPARHARQGFLPRLERESLRPIPRRSAVLEECRRRRDPEAEGRGRGCFTSTLGRKGCLLRKSVRTPCGRCWHDATRCSGWARPDRPSGHRRDRKLVADVIFGHKRAGRLSGNAIRIKGKREPIQGLFGLWREESRLLFGTCIVLRRSPASQFAERGFRFCL